MTDKVSKRTAASLAAVAVATITWMTIPATAQQQVAVSDPALIGSGRTAYAQKCRHCHGPNMVSGGTVAPDLRRFPDDRERFFKTVKLGKNGKMPPMGDLLNDEQIATLWAFAVSRRTP